MQQSEEILGYKPKKVLKNNSGFTLAELMIATGISTVVSLAIASIFVYTVQQFVVMVEMNTAQENLLWSSYHTKNLLGQAVGIDEDLPIDTNGDGFNDNEPSLDGFINDARTAQSINQAAGGGADLLKPARQVIVADFQREWGVSTSEYLPTRITWQRPSTDRGDQGQGYLFFDVNTPVGQSPGDPDFTDIFYDKMVQYELIPDARVNSQTVSVDVTITTRYHKSTNRNTWNWCVPTAPCPAADGSDAAFVDNTMNFSVALRNNRALEMNTTTNKPRSIHGGLYYYRYIPPQINF